MVHHCGIHIHHKSYTRMDSQENGIDQPPFVEEKNNQITNELNSINHYTFLVAVLLSAQTKDKSVNVITKKLFVLILNKSL